MCVHTSIVVYTFNSSSPKAEPGKFLGLRPLLPTCLCLCFRAGSLTVMSRLTSNCGAQDLTSTFHIAETTECIFTANHTSQFLKQGLIIPKLAQNSHYVAEDHLELLVLLPLPPSSGIAGICHHIQLTQCWDPTQSSACQASLLLRELYPQTPIFAFLFFQYSEKKKKETNQEDSIIFKVKIAHKVN